MHHTHLPPGKGGKKHLSEHVPEERLCGTGKGVGGIMGDSNKSDSESMQNYQQAAATVEQL